jgi:hypothetical protein
MDVMTPWNSTLELLEQAYWLWKFPSDWLQSKIQWSQATLRNARCMDDYQVCYWSFKAILILDPGDVKEAYSHIALCYYSLKWHVRSYGWHYESFGSEADSMDGRLILRREVSSTDAVKIFGWNDSMNRYTSHVYTYPRLFQNVTIIKQVGEGIWYYCWERTILYCPIPRGGSELCVEFVLCQTSTSASQLTWKRTK